MFDLTGQIHRKRALDWANQIRAILAKEGQPQAVAAVDDAIAQFETDKLTIAVLGKAKRGKSTLVNALLGRTDDIVAPVDVLPASSTISRFFHGAEDMTTVYFADGHTETISFGNIRDFVTEEGNPENRKGVTFVDITAPFPGLDPNVVLVDTPGAGSLHEHHDTLLHAFLPSADAVIFLVTAQMPIDNTELDLLRQIRAADIQRMFFVVNQVDVTAPRDLQDAVEHNTKVLASAGIHTNIVHRISARSAFEGRPDKGGIIPLVDEIRDFLSGGRLAAQIGRLRSRIEAVAGAFAAQVDLQLRESQCSRDELDQRLAELGKARTELESKRQSVDRNFILEWNTAIDDFEHRLGVIQRQTQQHFEQKIAATPLLTVKTLEVRLPGLILNDIEQRVRPAVDDLEKQLIAAAEKLQRSLPMLDIRSADGVAIRKLSDDEMKRGLIKGSFWATLGGSLPVASSLILTQLGAASSGGWLLGMAAGAAKIAVIAAATPLLTFVAGPVAAAAMAVAVAQVPLAWRRSMLKHKDHMPLAARDFISDAFWQLRTERLRELRKAGEILLRDYRLKLEQEITQTETTLVTIRERRPSEDRIAALRITSDEFHRVMKALPPGEEQGRGAKA